MASSPSLLIYSQPPTEEHFRKKQNLTQANARSFPKTICSTLFTLTINFSRKKGTWVIIATLRWKKKLCLDSLQYLLTWIMLRNLLVIFWKLLRVTMPRPGPLPRLQVLYSVSSAVDPSGHKSSYSCCSDSETRRRSWVCDRSLTWQQAQRRNEQRFSVKGAKGYAGSTVDQAHWGKLFLVNTSLNKDGDLSQSCSKYSLSCTLVIMFI